MQQITYRPIVTLHKLPGNPRLIRDKAFQTLRKSLADNADYFEARPLILSNRTGQLVIIAGNQRYEAAKANGLDNVPTILLPDLTEAREREIIIRDNVNNGEFDTEALANDWDQDDLADWGVDAAAWNLETDDDAGEDSADDENNYSRKVDTPTYEPVNEKPAVETLVDLTTYKQLVEAIERSSVSAVDKAFLLLAAQRHNVFNYQRVADYYANSSADVQELMEQSALVVIDFEKAIQYGFTSMSDTITDQFRTDYADGDNVKEPAQ